MSEQSEVLFSCFLIGPPLPHDIFHRSSRKTRAPVFHTFCIIFSKSVYLQRLVPKELKMGASKWPILHKTAKTQHQNAPTVKTCKKTPSGKAQPSEMHGRYTLFNDFSEAQGSQQHTQKGAKMEPPDTQNHKNPINKTFKKTVKYNTATKMLVAAF